MLACPASEFFLAGILGGLEILFQPFNRDAPTAIRCHHPPVFRVAPLLRIRIDFVRKLIEHRQHSAVALAVPNGASLVELRFEHAGRRTFRLRRDEGEEAFRLRYWPAAKLADDAI